MCFSLPFGYGTALHWGKTEYPDGEKESKSEKKKKLAPKNWKQYHHNNRAASPPGCSTELGSQGSQGQIKKGSEGVQKRLKRDPKKGGENGEKVEAKKLRFFPLLGSVGHWGRLVPAALKWEEAESAQKPP